jgi:Raf kinase inhibitor-like YbhB/YbcL family protein
MAQHSSGELIAIQRIQPRELGRLTLMSEAVGDDGRIGDAYSSYHDNQSPPLVWTGMPDAESFALVVEDPDAPLDKPVVHWAMWNIPGALEGLPSAIRPEARVEEYGGMVQGLNTRGQFGYMGPKPPPGDGPHRYHFQLFALDTRLDLPPTTPFEELVQVLKAHTIAACDLVGLYERPTLEDQPSEARTGSYGSEPRSFTEAERNAGRGGLDRDDVDRHAPHDSEGVVNSGSAGT